MANINKPKKQKGNQSQNLQLKMSIKFAETHVNELLEVITDYENLATFYLQHVSGSSS